MIVGYIQNNPVFGDVPGNLSRAEELLAKIQGDLIVFPELFATGYQFTRPEEARNLAEPVPEGPTTEWLSAQARDRNAVLVAGLAEREDDRVYNSAVIAGPEGYLGKYRKAHLFDTEVRVFHPGSLPFPVFDIGCARVGVMVCFDWRFPETARTLALKGADIIAHPSNLVLPHCPQAMITRCLENRVFAVTADRVGMENRIENESLKFIGQSQVVDPDGNVLCRASATDEESGTVEIDIQKARNKNINTVNHLLKDRREDLYRVI